MNGCREEEITVRRAHSGEKAYYILRRQDYAMYGHALPVTGTLRGQVNANGELSLVNVHKGASHITKDKKVMYPADSVSKLSAVRITRYWEQLPAQSSCHSLSDCRFSFRMTLFIVICVRLSARI